MDQGARDSEVRRRGVGTQLVGRPLLQNGDKKHLSSPRRARSCRPRPAGTSRPASTLFVGRVNFKGRQVYHPATTAALPSGSEVIVL